MNTAPVQVEFSGDLTIRAVAGAQERLVRALGEGSRIVASVVEVASVDLTFIQLIEAARRAATAVGGEVALAAPATGPLLETLRRGGFLEAADSREFWLMESGGQ